MDPKTVHTLHEYNQWANARLLDAIGGLSNEDFLKAHGSAQRSIRDILMHILNAEFMWLTRWKGNPPPDAFNPSDFPDLQSLKEKRSELELDESNFLSKISDESLEEIVSYETASGKTFQYPLWQMILHMFNHSTHHRGQVTAIQRQLGIEPVNLDFIRFVAQQKSSNI